MLTAVLAVGAYQKLAGQFVVIPEGGRSVEVGVAGRNVRIQVNFVSIKRRIWE